MELGISMVQQYHHQETLGSKEEGTNKVSTSLEGQQAFYQSGENIIENRACKFKTRITSKNSSVESSEK